MTLIGLFLLSCAHQPPPTPPKEKMKTEFLLMGYKSLSDKSEKTEQILGKKRSIYNRLKDLSSKSHIVILYDASGSMRERIGGNGPKKFEAAYEGLRQIVPLFRANDNLKLIVFGSKKTSGITTEGVIIRRNYMKAMEACGDVEVVYNSPKEGFDQKEFLVAIQFLGSEKTYIGDTPIGYSVLKAHALLKGLSNSKVILITDGEETGPLLAHAISKDKAWEQKLKKQYSNFDELTLSALDGIKRLVDDHIHFSPILYGLGASANDQEAQKIRNFYHKLATSSGSVYLEAITPQEILNAFMDAEMMSFTYGLYATEPNQKGQLVAKGKIGIPILVETGRYLLRIETERSFEQEIELKPQKKNVHIFNLDSQGKLMVIPMDSN